MIGIAATFGEENIKKPVQYISTITNHAQLWWVPNIVVAHGEEGIEAVHLTSGQTLCKLHLQEGGLHADINRDWVLDHVQAVGGNGAELTIVGGSMDVLQPCWAVATSGVRVPKPLFNACHDSQFKVIFSFEDRTEDIRLELSRFRHHRRKICTNFGIEARFGEENIKKVFGITAQFGAENIKK